MAIDTTNSEHLSRRLIRCSSRKSSQMAMRAPPGEAKRTDFAATNYGLTKTRIRNVYGTVRQIRAGLGR